jgi:outer membrane protein TolC
LQVEEARLYEQIESLQDKEKLQRQQFNLLMHRSADSSLSFPDTMKLREMPIVDWPQLERDNPRLQQLLAQGKMYDAQADMVKGQGRPMIGIGLEYMLNGRVDMPVMPSMNGMDMLMPMLKVTLPIYRKKTEAGIKSARLMKESTVFDYQRQQDMLRSQYLSIEQQATDAKREILLYDKEMNLLDRTLQLMMTEYANGTTSLTDILQTSRENIDYALKQFETQAKYNILVAEYEKLASKYDYVQK